MRSTGAIESYEPHPDPLLIGEGDPEFVIHCVLFYNNEA